MCIYFFQFEEYENKGGSLQKWPLAFGTWKSYVGEEKMVREEDKDPCFGVKMAL